MLRKRARPRNSIRRRFRKRTGTRFNGRRMVLESLEDRRLLTTLVQITDSPASGLNVVRAIDASGDHMMVLSNQDYAGSNTDGNIEVFLHDSTAGTFTQITETEGTPANWAVAPVGGAISQDGSRVVFASPFDLVSGSNQDGNWEIFVYDTSTQSLTQLTHVTVGDSTDPSLSADGRWVAFQATADLVGGNSDGNSEIYLIDTQTNTISQVTSSVDEEGSGRIGSKQAAINGDGTRVVFVSTADLLGGSNQEHGSCVFLYDAATDDLVQLTAETGNASDPAIDNDGTRVVFVLSNDAIMLVDTVADTTEQISHDTAFSATISTDGNRVAYRALVSSTDLTVYVYDKELQTEIVVASRPFGSPISLLKLVNSDAVGVLLSANGTLVAFTEDAELDGMNTDEGFDVFAASDFESHLITDALLNVDENSVAGTVVGIVPVTDPTVALSFEIVGGNFNNTFAIGGTTGEITVNSGVDIDYETAPVFTLLVRATDTSAPPQVDIATITVNVNDLNETPVLMRPISDQDAWVGRAFDFTIAADTFHDEDNGDTLSYAAALDDGSELPAWLSFSSATRAFSGTPAEADLGDVSIVVTATDDGDPVASANDTFVITVRPNQAPWQNPANRFNVGNENDVEPIDALLVLQYLNQFLPGPLPEPPTPNGPPPFVDVNGDNDCTPFDALLVIIELNRLAAQGAVSQSAELANDVAPIQADPWMGQQNGMQQTGPAASPLGIEPNLVAGRSLMEIEPNGSELTLPPSREAGEPVASTLMTKSRGTEFGGNGSGSIADVGADNVFESDLEDLLDVLARDLSQL